MTFGKYKSRIEDGDTVVLFLGFHNLLQTTVKKGKIHQTKYGALRHSDVIGKKFGAKLQCTKGYIYVLYPTPELWTLTLPHRTQILYTTDISLITLQLDLQPGSVVLESGTGSGSLSHAILRTVAPSGHLHTYDFHEERAGKARLEFAEHGFDHLVTVSHRDVCKEGFKLENVADAVFLDLPSPWFAVPHAKKALKTEGGRLCSFSPCIEQVQKTCSHLREHGFSDVRTMECLVRMFDPKTISIPIADLGYGTSENFAPVYEDVGRSAYKPVTGQVQQNLSEEDEDGQGEERQAGPENDTAEMEDDEASELVGAQKRKRIGDKHKACKKPATEANFLFKEALTPKEMPGHTGYLTFATLYP